jgi:hypothetical protein
LKLNYDIPLSNFAFKFNLGLYSEVMAKDGKDYIEMLIEASAAGAYTRPFFSSIVSTFCGLRWVASMSE